ncbi:hypothetical protein BJ912DRAFT_987386 [Pholiota molesta]|nr:hypothetical protein BJ912DRAFT_987386 [Pholiota molesta]
MLRMMFSALLLILSVPISVHVSLTSPTPHHPRKGGAHTDSVNLTTKCSCWIHGIIEILILVLPTIAQQFPQSTAVQWANNAVFHYFLPTSVGNDTTISFPPLRMLGAFLIIFGSTIRYLCYRELGRHFTFHVAILDGHSLVTTGPYSIVRHPSYSGGVIQHIGVVLWHSTLGAWIRQSRFYTKPITWIGIVPMFITMGIFATIVVRRPKEEDKMLKKEFGKQWDVWARRVPYRLIPGIY